MSSRVSGLEYKGNRLYSFEVRDVKALVCYLIRKRNKEISSILISDVLLQWLSACSCVCVCVCIGTVLNAIIFSGTLKEIKRLNT